MVYNRNLLELAVCRQTVKQTDHNIHHHQRVYKIGLQIAAEEKLAFDGEILHAASYLHDTGYCSKKCTGDKVSHYIYSMEFAKEALPRVGFPQAKIPCVLESIRVHDQTKPWAIREGLHEKVDIIEAKLLQDADNIDGHGVLGLFRIDRYDASVGKVFFNPKFPLSPSYSKESTLHNMLLHLGFESRMNFKSGLCMMAERNAAMRYVVAELIKNLNP